MKLVYATDPYATLLIVDDDKELNWTLKSLGVSGFGAANQIADAVANGVITIDELMPAEIGGGADAINFINNRNAINLGEEMNDINVDLNTTLNQARLSSVIEQWENPECEVVRTIDSSASEGTIERIVRVEDSYSLFRYFMSSSTGAILVSADLNCVDADHVIQHLSERL